MAWKFSMYKFVTQNFVNAQLQKNKQWKQNYMAAVFNSIAGEAISFTPTDFWTVTSVSGSGLQRLVKTVMAQRGLAFVVVEADI